MNNKLRKLAFIPVLFCLFFAQNAAANDGMSLSTWEDVGNEFGMDWRAIYAVALKESRRSTDGIVHPWPWAINSSRGGCFCESKDAAAAKITELLEQGIRSIDVGLMQINFKWHGDKVDGDIYRLLDVKTNLRVGAGILRTALDSTDDLVIGLGRYHSYKEDKAKRYGADAYRYLTNLMDYGLHF